MEKLIELLNEYIEKNINTPNRCIGYSCLYFGFDGGTDVIEDTIISKRYGFIKWLVDNDKIDVNKVKKEFYNNICITEYGDEDRAMGDDNLVIAVLSINDIPIEFLCSILK